MIIRFRVAASLGNYFGGSALSTVEHARLPEVGDAYDDGQDSYRVVKVLDDVDPDVGSDQRGAVVYVMRSGRHAVQGSSPEQGMIARSLEVSTVLGLRDCIERANSARRAGSSEDYRRHVEEFLFLSSTITKGIRPGHGSAPFLPVYSHREEIATLIREGLIDSCYPAQVESVRSLEGIAYTLDRMDVTRPSLFIITEIIDYRSGGAAMQLIRSHSKGKVCQILVLSQSVRDNERQAAMAFEADAYANFPDRYEQYAALADRIRGMLGSRRAHGVPDSSSA